MNARFLTFLFFLILVSCKNDTKISTPETSLVLWQKLVDQGHFAQAEKWSTPSTILWFKGLDETTDNQDLGSLTVFKDLNCETSADTASCSYHLIEQNEKLYFTTQLVKVEGTWLVDIHDE